MYICKYKADGRKESPTERNCELSSILGMVIGD